MSDPSPTEVSQSKTRAQSRGGRRSRRNASRSQVTAAQPDAQDQPYTEEEDGAEEAPQPQRRRRQQKTATQSGSGGLLGGSGVDDVLPIGNVGETAGNLVNGATGALSNVAGGVLGGNDSGKSGKSDTLRLRLDLNLEVEVTLKARIHGDLELALLTG